MEKEFIPYEQALDLKELGFDEPCLAKYVIYNSKDPIALFPQSQNFFKGYFSYCKNSDYTDKIAAPVYQQAFRWFREKYNLICKIDIYSYSHTETNFEYDISNKENTISEYSTIHKSYENAELECLKKLIEIVKNK